MFKKDGPSNPERHSKCNEKKDNWFKCIDTVTQREKLDLKPEYEEDQEKVKDLPIEKLVINFFKI